MAHGLGLIDWQAPWLAPYCAAGQPLAQQVMAGVSCAVALNSCEAMPVRFVPQAALPGGMAYEQYIFEQRGVPTRDGLHDFFNGIDRVAALGQKADVLFITGYQGLHREVGGYKSVPPAEVMAWTEAHSKALPLAAKNGFVPDGGSLAIASSAHEQGQTAGRLTAALLQGRSPSEFPVVQGQAFVVLMHAERLARRGYRLPAVYEAAARAAGTLN